MNTSRSPPWWHAANRNRATDQDTKAFAATLEKAHTAQLAQLES